MSLYRLQGQEIGFTFRANVDVVVALDISYLDFCALGLFLTSSYSIKAVSQFFRTIKVSVPDYTMDSE